MSTTRGLVDVVAENAIASSFLGRLWSAIVPIITLPEEVQHPVRHAQMFDPAYVCDVPLPLASHRQLGRTVALVDKAGFHRKTGERAIESAYLERRRTRVYEGMDARSDGWFSVTAAHLARLARCRVVCSMYESDSGDQNMGAHIDEWFGAIVQLRGAKRWTIWPGLDSDPEEMLMRAGDVLLLPRGIQHDVSTPDYSVHLVFAFIANEPIE